MTQSPQFNDTYNICVIDVGSPDSDRHPPHGKIGWCVIDTDSNKRPCTGENLDCIFKHIEKLTQNKGLILGLEAPLIIPVRTELKCLTRKRDCDNIAWSSGVGANALTPNLPIMPYLFNGIKSAVPDVSFYPNENGFEAKPKQIMLFEAFISGENKGSSHIEDAEKMAKTCLHYAQQRRLPQPDYAPDEEWFNLAAAALLRCGLANNLKRNSNTLSIHTPIYKPNRP